MTPPLPSQEQRGILEDAHRHPIEGNVPDVSVPRALPNYGDPGRAFSALAHVENFFFSCITADSAGGTRDSKTHVIPTLRRRCLWGIAVETQSTPCRVGL